MSEQEAADQAQDMSQQQERLIEILNNIRRGLGSEEDFLELAGALGLSKYFSH